MQAVTRKKRISAVDLRARVPAIARMLALFLLIAAAIVIGVSYYKMRHNTIFRLAKQPAQLSTEITGIINGYEQRITKKDRLYLWLRAARDVTYADGHHELEQVNLQVFSPTEDKHDQITADRSLYDQKLGLIQFNGNVNIETRDQLKVKTDSVLYHQDTEVGETPAPITFERHNVAGQATGFGRAEGSRCRRSLARQFASVPDVQGERLVSGADREGGLLEGRLRHHRADAVRQRIALCRQAEDICVEVVIGVLVVEGADRISAGRQIVEHDGHRRGARA